MHAASIRNETDEDNGSKMCIRDRYATELLPYIKMSVDRSKRKGDFWITGSQVFRLMNNVSESLAGRVGIVNLLGLSDAEIYKTPSEPFTSDAARLMDRLSVTEPRGLNEMCIRDSIPSVQSHHPLRRRSFRHGRGRKSRNVGKRRRIQRKADRQSPSLAVDESRMGGL